jgi:hypothetical protein
LFLFNNSKKKCAFRWNDQNALVLAMPKNEKKKKRELPVHVS